jgi:hypothetical protein
VRPAEDASPDIYVYRDTSEQSDDPAAAGQATTERDASYWYDLSAEDSAPVPEETRGPFEPLISSSGPSPGTAPLTPDAAPAAGAAGTGGRHAAPDVAGSEGQEDAAYAQARKLEQIKDLYLTAEAIGERNVDKHFDQLMAQQRELISEYFKESTAAKPADGGQPQAGSQDEPQAGAAPTHIASVSGEQPRVW